MNNNKHIIAAFDFDGTITYCDTFIPFLLFISGKAQFTKHLFFLIPQFLAYKLGRITNVNAKEAFISSFLSGTEYSQLQILGKEFAVRLLPRLVRKQMVEKIRWHKKQGHQCILVSASLDIYLRPWATLVGLDDVISSQLEINEQGYITGKLKGDNCYGVEKSRRMREWLSGSEPYYLYAYGDSAGDIELLGMADKKYYKGKLLP